MCMHGKGVHMGHAHNPSVQTIFKMNSAVYFVCIVFCIVGYQCTGSNAVELSQSLLDAIRNVESGGDVCALRDSTSGASLGAYQITHEYYQDAVEANATLTANGQGTY